MTGHPTPASMPCPHGCAHHLTPDTTCPHCGHTLTIAEVRRLEQKDRGRAALSRVRAEWEAHKAANPRPTTTTRRTA